MWQCTSLIPLVYIEAQKLSFKSTFYNSNQTQQSILSCTHTEKGLFPKPPVVLSRPSLSLLSVGFLFAHHLSKMCPPSIKSGVIRKTPIIPMAGQSGRNGPAGDIVMFPAPDKNHAVQNSLEPNNHPWSTYNLVARCKCWGFLGPYTTHGYMYMYS